MNWDKIYKEAMKTLGKKLQEFSWENPNSYAQWLGQTHHFVEKSTRLLALASARTLFSQQDLHNRFIAHAAEEKGHDKLLTMDLKALGRTIDQIPELPQTAALYKTQYYYIEHKNPSAFLGWILALESMAANYGPDVYQRTVKAHGEKASKFLRVHSTEDQDHIEKALAAIHQVPPDQREDLVTNFQHSSSFYSGMLDNCMANSRVLLLKKAA